MGQALYRKYRSKSLDEVVGQEHITTTLSAALKSGRVSHAYLLTGPRGVGKTSVARILAFEVNGLPYDEESTHLDIIEIDAASNRRIDEIRDLRDKVHIAPAAARYKVYIIDEVHMLTREAFNALLKTLEEPPAHAIFILATTEAYKLPETIVSRTQRFTFRPIDKPKVVEHLREIAKNERIQIDDEALELIAEHGDGSFRDSISLLDQLGSSGQKISGNTVLETLGQAPAEQIEGLKTAISQASAPEIVKVLQGMFLQGYEPSRIARQLGQNLRKGLLEGKSPLGQAATISLLAELLDVPRSSDPATKLELALLKLANFEQSVSTPKQKAPEIKPTPTAEAKPQPKKPAKTAEVPKKTETQGKPAEQPAETAQPSLEKLGDDLDDVWQQVMKLIKQQHNTLYSVMRLARPAWGEGELKLMFGFSFHQKRINEPKNRETIASLIEQITGRRISVVSELDEELKPTVEADEPASIPAADPVISNISNIFGGAELVES